MITRSLETSKFLESLDAKCTVVLTDKNVEQLVLPKLSALHAFQRISITPGETSKRQETVDEILLQMHRLGMDRSSTLIGLGGGVVTDLAGYCASIYMRGIDVVQFPTSLLAMVDAAIGGKTGINTAWGKNMVGTFHQPEAVLYQPDVLQTLPERHLKSGFVEAWKTIVMCRPMDWQKLTYPLSESQIIEVANTKLQLVEVDFHEQNKRAWLNFGHTIGHAFEHLYHQSHDLLHGEAIAWGMLAEMYLFDADKDMLTYWENWVLENIPKLPFNPSDRDQLLDIMQADKKSKDGTLYVALPYKDGSAVVPAKKDAMIHALNQLWNKHLS